MSDGYGAGVGGQPESTLPGRYGGDPVVDGSPYRQVSAHGQQGASYGALPGGYGAPPVYEAQQGWSQSYPVPSATDPGIDKPWYGIGYLDAYRRFWKKYATFSGRASLGEFWWATLVNVVISVLLAVIVAVIASAVTTPCADYEVGTSACPDGGNGLGFVALIYLYPAAILIPTFAIVWRRLHDAGQSGAMYFVSLVPFVGDIILLIFLAQSSRSEGAKFDASPGAYHAGPGVPGYPAPGVPHQYGYTSGPASGRGGKRLVWGLVGGAVVLLLVVVVAAVLAAQDRTSRNAELAADSEAAAVVMVKDYLGAVAAADAAAVRQILPDYLDEYGSTALITDEVLAASAATAPLTDIQVELVSVTGSEHYPKAVVRANYRFGGDRAEQTFDLSGSVGRSGSTEWDLISTTATYSPASLEGIEVAVNGQVVPSGDQEVYLVVPGAYQVTATSPYYSLDQADLRLIDPNSSQPWHVVPTLSEEGKQAFRTAVRGAVETCLASKSLVAGCGLDLEATLSNGTVDDGTLTRTLTPEADAALATLEPTLRPGSPSVATCGAIGGVTTTASGTVDGRRGTIEITTGIAGLVETVGGSPISLQNPSVTMTDPALPVTW